ncbi:hypothetical protein SSSV7_gp08 [Sulfolobus spindle-shaped virus 7]|uniref:Uncharacterized protein n=1 Tax=Sulfolobus spindle-shaped virus 7 TaxID=693628 RepID=D1GF59_9VIRU|nr:hypothetical protein SSSV7_gp08 [Sulfolobus spindle-shaped virus 7]ACZ35761.1 hypothetical protein [Sulfolobus spindle-shaped virus 7]
MLIHAGLNTHSNRISVKKLKEDGKDSSITRKTEYMILCSRVKIQSAAACSHHRQNVLYVLRTYSIKFIYLYCVYRT